MICRRRAVCGEKRSGFGRLDFVICLLVAGLSLNLLLPTIVSLREASRKQTCSSRLATIGIALRAYHDTHNVLPPAAIWSGGPLRTTALHDAKRFDLTTHENWAICLLPFLDQTALEGNFDRRRPIGNATNQLVRTTDLAALSCPSDDYHRPDNNYRFDGGEHARQPLEFARGNYALNGGTHNPRLAEESTAFPGGDRLHLVMNGETGEYQLLGTGIAGFNCSLSWDDFANGTATMVAIEEIRAGMHPFDLRGVWSLGQIGSSVTWAHGISSDAYGPNNPWPRSDDIIGCKRLHELLGKDALQTAGMPCVDYIDKNDQAASRSLHPGGTHVLFLDGHVRFVRNEVDIGLWHVMHSRETPANVLLEGFDARLDSDTPAPEKTVTESPASPVSTEQADELLTNSIGMKFVTVPAGEFTMGVPDNGGGYPAECPAHPVRITRSFRLGQFEVTQREFLEVMGQNPSRHTATEAATGDAGNYPVERVTWDEAVDFCRKLSSIPEEQNSGRSYRLPTEAEWEYACRGGSSEPYRWQSTRTANDDSGAAAGMLPALPIRPVGSYRANPFGLHDMRGNVWEWCSDWFDRKYYSRSPVDDPQGPADGHLKVLRGGDWIFVGEACRINYSILSPWKSSPFVGFRVVCVANVQTHR